MAPAAPEKRTSDPAAPEAEGAAEVSEQVTQEATEQAVSDGTPPETEEVAEPERALEQDIEELRSKAAERDEYLALAQRTQADFENYRKRTAKDVAGAESRGVVKVAKELLPALDNLERALAAVEEHSSDDDAERLAEGIRLVQTELVAGLARLGIEAYSPVGEPFDPEQHEAMAQQPVEGAEPGTVVEVYQPGYRLDGSVLRAARVVVAE